MGSLVVPALVKILDHQLLEYNARTQTDEVVVISLSVTHFSHHIHQIHFLQGSE